MTKRDGLLSWPAVVFTWTRSQDGAEIGQFSINRGNAAFSSANHRDDFRIRKSFWRDRWVYEGSDDRLFARIGLGFKSTITFADDTRYRLKVKRRWWRFGAKAADEYVHLATFSRDETPVMILQNNQTMPFFSTELRTPMSGTISTELTDVRIISGLLLLFQTSLMRRQSAAAAS